MAEVAEKSALVVLGGISVALISQAVKLLISRGRNRGAQDTRNLERERMRADQETQLRVDLMLLVGGLQAKEAEHQKMIDLLREQNRKTEDKLDKQTRAKHDILSETSHLSLVIQAYRMSPGGQIDADNVDLNRLADICKTGDEQ